MASKKWTAWRGLLATTALAGMALFTGTSGVLAQTAPPTTEAGAVTVHVSVPAGALEQGILSFSRQANIRLLYPSAITRGKTTGGVSGTLPVRDAITQLLAGSGLGHRFTGQNTVSIFDPAARSGEAADGATLLDTVVVEGQLQGIAGIVETNGYVSRGGRTATKTDTPAAETPQSASTVGQQQLQDLKPQNLTEVLNYTPGFRGGQYGSEPRYDAFKVRGMDLSYTGIFRDGIRQIASPNGLFRLEPYGLEAVTILRGPAASIYGASSSGGIVDLISKRPTEEVLREIEIQFGSPERKQAAFDLSGPVTEDHSLLMRLTGVIRDGEHEIDAIEDDRTYIAPALTWQPSGNTKFTLLGEYMDSTTGGTWGYINNDDSGKSIGALPVYGGDERFNDFTQEQWRIGYELEHGFSDTLTLYHKLRYSTLSTRQEWVFENYPGITIEDNSGLASDTYLKSDFATGALRHQLIAGFDYSYMKYDAGLGSGPDLFTDTFSYVPAVTSLQAQEQESFGLYVQDQIELDAWRLTLGIRHDWHTSDYTETYLPLSTVASYSRDDSETTGRVALAYVTPWGVVPYVSYGTSFVTNPGVVVPVDGISQQAEPTLGEQVEIGVKYEVPDRNILITAALFNIEQENASVWETSSGENHQIQLDLRSRGFELEATASLDNGLSFIAAYSYNDVEITKLTATTAGKTLNSSPYHIASLWTDYQFQDETLVGLGLGAGVRYVGSSFGDNEHTPVLDNDARTFVDATVRYDLGEIAPPLEGARLQVNATNLLDEVNQVCTTGFCYFDEGRKVIGSLRYRF